MAKSLLSEELQVLFHAALLGRSDIIKVLSSYRKYTCIINAYIHIVIFSFIHTYKHTYIHTYIIYIYYDINIIII